MNKIKVFLFFLLLTDVVHSQEQKPAFWNDIQAFRKQDAVSLPPKNAILFIGSSSFTMWKDVQTYFPSYTIINRGFGGSSLPDVIRYANDIISPYQPKQIVIYCGENDLAASDTVTAKLVFNRFKQLFTIIRNRYPKVKVTYVSMKPSPSRQLLLSKMISGNELIKKYLSSKKRTSYVDVYKEMIDDEGKPRADLFLDDNLHMNKTGYAIWQKFIEPHLLK
ncbi:MAG TPA: GDSL-type esterase/lipase family protein [Chitinophagaceae bacterium]|nr:GDSL-type esterase/lipase family protein [Chitinophagaceae bacterium]